ncbi:MAG: serine protease [Myxococcota bacterium]
MRITLLSSLALLAACETAAEISPTPAFSTSIEEEAAPSDFETFDLQDVRLEVLDIAYRFIAVDLGDGAADEAVIEDARELQIRFAHALAASATFDELEATGETVEIQWLGVGLLSDDLEDASLADQDVPDSPTIEDVAGAVEWVGFNPGSRNEFMLRMPLQMSALIGAEGVLRGVPDGSESLDGEGPVLTSQVGNADTRVLKGSKNTAQTATNFKRIVSFTTGCTGTLVGRHHVLSAGHCIRRTAKNGNPASWSQPELRVGRNGTDWIASADTSTGWRWFWVEASYYTASNNGSSPRSTDFGLIITPSRHIGSSTGWFGWQYSNSEHDDMYNRGYPGTPPLANHSRHLFGDSNNCKTGDYSSSKDSYNYRLFGYHSCDTSGGHSGSALYRKNGSAWVVRGVHKGATNPGVTNGSSNSTLWNSFALVTRERSAQISAFRASYP